MKRILAIAVLTVRGAIRSRFIFTLAAMVMLTVIALPSVITGDGTIRGYARVAILYTLNSVFFLLAVANIWLAVRTSAIEIEEQQMQLLVIKPVNCGQIWIGKWLGILAMNAIILAAAGACAYGMIRWQLRPSRLSEADLRVLMHEVLTARAPTAPDDPCHEVMVRQLFEERIRKGDPGRKLRAIDLYEAARREADRTFNTVNPGESREWTFHLPQQADRGAPLSVSFRFSSPRELELEPLAMEWYAGPPGRQTVRAYRGELFGGAVRSIAIPQGAVGDDGALVLRYLNSQTNPPAVVVLDRRQGTLVMVRRGSFEANLFRALAVVFCKLSVLAAIGLTMGNIFSMPIAVFSSFAVVVVFMFAGFVETAATDTDMMMYRPPSLSALDPLMKTEFQLLNAVLSPLKRFDVLPLLPQGMLVPWSAVLSAVVTLALPFGCILGLVGSWLLSRRQLALPSD